MNDKRWSKAQRLAYKATIAARKSRRQAVQHEINISTAKTPMIQAKSSLQLDDSQVNNLVNYFWSMLPIETKVEIIMEHVNDNMPEVE